MEYRTAKQMAEKWNMSERYLQKLCSIGRVEGATKVAKYWMIPENAMKPVNLRKSSGKAEQERREKELKAEQYKHDIMPLMSATFEIGKCTEYIESITDKNERTIAWAEYYYYTGNHKKCSDISEKYIHSDILELRVTATWLYSSANLSLDRLNNTKHVLKFVQELYNNIDDNTSKLDKALAVCLYNTILTEFHIKKPKGTEEAQYYLRELPVGLRYFILYAQAYYAYQCGFFPSGVAIAETCIAFDEIEYPVAKIYLHLVSAMCYIQMGFKALSEKYLLEALKFAEPDGFLMPFAELHMDMCGMYEAVIKKKNLTTFRAIVALTKKHSYGWLKFHNEITDSKIPTDLTPTEFTVAMLVARGWATKEIADHLGITVSAVQKYKGEAMDKMGVSKRSQIVNIMFPEK